MYRRGSPEEMELGREEGNTEVAFWGELKHALRPFIPFAKQVAKNPIAQGAAKLIIGPKAAALLALSAAAGGIHKATGHAKEAKKEAKQEPRKKESVEKLAQTVKETKEKKEEPKAAPKAKVPTRTVSPAFSSASSLAAQVAANRRTAVRGSSVMGHEPVMRPDEVRDLIQRERNPQKRERMMMNYERAMQKRARVLGKMR